MFTAAMTALTLQSFVESTRRRTKQPKEREPAEQWDVSPATALQPMRYEAGRVRDSD